MTDDVCLGHSTEQWHPLLGICHSEAQVILLVLDCSHTKFRQCPLEAVTWRLASKVVHCCQLLTLNSSVVYQIKLPFISLNSSTECGVNFARVSHLFHLAEKTDAIEAQPLLKSQVLGSLYGLCNLSSLILQFTNFLGCKAEKPPLT